jgi:hypothetical protein
MSDIFYGMNMLLTIPKKCIGAAEKNVEES